MCMYYICIFSLISFHIYNLEQLHVISAAFFNIGKICIVCYHPYAITS